ncbi:TatD family hydrolase [Feifania hominis]|uniref:TatD family hydrolase n=1 Tax=Feifania hominis TaxID=2763660 RepID=A0A926DE37_9FIRM|nr:TatD family hydrolase [Feifania hominis]MBC8536141.1 TatD family hydrolase [Feifania hominis]
MLCDAHTHIETQAQVSSYARQNIFCVASGGTPDECADLLALRGAYGGMSVSFGLHPWYADRYSLEQMEPYLCKASIIGEIGLDSVWCQVDPGRQREIFLRQLDFAQQRRLPVILHTKGCEQECAALLSRYTMPKVIHWYSCEHHLEHFLEQDCYFTIGPSVRQDPNVLAVAERAPLRRLLVETDGLSGIRWALGRDLTTRHLGAVLRSSIEAIAALRGLTPAEVEKLVFDNYSSLFTRGLPQSPAANHGV